MYIKYNLLGQYRPLVLIERLITVAAKCRVLYVYENPALSAYAAISHHVKS